MKGEQMPGTGEVMMRLSVDEVNAVLKPVIEEINDLRRRVANLEAAGWRVE